MPSAYSFIDLAVLDEVRERFARGEALAILSVDLDQVIWVNGPGARLFGEAEIDAVIDASPQLGPAARRQIMATSGYPEIGRDRSAVVRLSSGAASRVVAFLVSSVRLPDGEHAIVLAEPSAEASADLAISGLSGPGQFAAIIGGDGETLAASEGFDTLGLDTPVLMSLAAETSPAQRVVKRVITARRAAFPAGLARLSDDPACFLLIVVDEAGAATAEAGDFEAALQESEPAGMQPQDDDEAALLDESARSEPSREVEAALQAEARADAVGGSRSPGDSTTIGAAEPARDGRGETGGDAPNEHGHDAWYFNAAREPGATEPTLRRKTAIDRSAEPVRFVWRTDADGRFSAISPEFAQAVGEEAAAVLGRSFGDVANVFGLDSGHEVAGLLERRDTWSGRVVFWPVAGAALRVPVDLAALPVYNRNRQFEGFRGFGVVRLADMVADPEGIGLALVSPAAPAVDAAAGEPQADQAPEEAGDWPDDPFHGEVPALALVPMAERRFSDKVIRLAERRPATSEKGLSPVERSAFREIGERLKKDRKRAKESSAASEPAPDSAPRAAEAVGAPTDAAAAGTAGDPALGGTVHVATDGTGQAAPDDAEETAPDDPDQAQPHATLPTWDGAAIATGDDPASASAEEPATASGDQPAAAPSGDAHGSEESDSLADTVETLVEAEHRSGYAESFAENATRFGQAAANPVRPGDVAGEESASGAEPSAPAPRRKRRIAFRYEHEVPPSGSRTDALGEAEMSPPRGLHNAEPSAHAAMLDLQRDDQAGSSDPAEAVTRPAEAPEPAPSAVEGDAADGASTDRRASTEDEVAILMAAVNRGETELASDGPAAEPIQASPVAADDAEPAAKAGSEADSERGGDMSGTHQDAAGPDASERPEIAGDAEAGQPGIRPASVRLPRADWVAPRLDGEDASPEGMSAPGSGAAADDAARPAAASGSGPAPTLGPSDFDAAELDRSEPVSESRGNEGDALSPPSPRAAESTLPVSAEPYPSQHATSRAREPMPDQPLPTWPQTTAARGNNEPLEQRIIDRLPVPILIHAGDTLHYANPEFLYLTGYHTLNDLRAAGGLGALFAEPYSGEDDTQNRVLRLRTGDGLEFPIEALLRSVAWNSGTALMLVVKRTGEEPSDAGEEPEEAGEEQGTPGEERREAQPDDGDAGEEPGETAALGSVAAGPDAPISEPDAAGSPAAMAPASGQLAELQARFAEMRTIMDTATDGVVLILPDGTIRSISRPAEALFGFDSAAVEGKPFTSLFAMESQRAARDYLAGLAEHGVASVLNDGREVIGREAEGRFIPLFMTIGKLPDDGGFCAVMRDITQWKRAEEELTQAKTLAERASTQKTEFLARISHEIRTPLNAIIGFSELMMDERFGPVGNDRYRDYLRDINRSGNHVLDLVNDLLDISKIEAGQQEMNYEAVSLNDTLAETVAMMQPQANRERVIIRSSFGSKLPEVVADLRSVRQIALNILSNAIRYTQAGGQVIVSTAYEPSGDIVLRVRDTGIGMTAAEIEQALKPFKQINSLRRGRGDGTGLGLPLTKAMVEANRARFTIASTPGEGTLVEVTFPATRVLAG